MYMQQRTGSFKEQFSKNTFYRFLNSAKTNRLRFTSLLAADIVNNDIRDLTNQERKNVFIIDDSLFSRTSCKKTELGSRVFDHTDMHFKKGFRMLTLSWSDGNTLVPVNSCLLASAKDTNIIGPVKDFDSRTIAGKRRKLAQTKAPVVMMTLLVCVRNKANRKDWLAFICTDTTLSEEEIIRVYGKRWQIEVFFKTCKSMLNLIGECHSLSYDALTAHVAIVFTRYMLLAMEQRENED